MHPRLVELTSYLDEQRAVLAAAVSDVPSTLQRTKPPSGGWSVAEVLEHLVLIERRMAGLFKTWADEARSGALAQETEDSPILSSIDTASVLNRTRKVVASPAGHPTGTMRVEEASDELDRIRTEMKAVLGTADGLALTKIVKPHPALGPMNMYEWIAFTAAHMGRHAAQIREAGLALQAAQGA